jgi:basic membrane protein A and related proteins
VIVRRRVLSIAFITLLASVLSACHGPRGIAEGGNVRLGMVTDTGGLGDRSFNDGAYLGLKNAQTELHADLAVLQSRSAADYQPNLTVLANKEEDEIFAIGYLMARDTDEVASRFPARHFAIIDAVVPQPNVASVTFREQDGSFLAGAAAAMASKTKTIAFIGGIDIPLLRKFEAGYTAGARSVVPSIKVLDKYVGSFDDVAAGKELASVLFDQGADVIYVAAGKAGLGAIEQVKLRPNAYIIGVDVDQDALVPGKILTSMIKRVDVAVFMLAREAASQKPRSGHIELGLKDGAVSLTNFRYTRSVLTPAQFHTLDALRGAIIDGSIVPPATREQLATFVPPHHLP